MTALDLKLADGAIAREIGACIGRLFDTKARERIASAWLDGNIDGDEAVELLIALDLIEVPHE